MRARANLIRFVGSTLLVVAVATPTAQIRVPTLQFPPFPPPNLGKLDHMLSDPSGMVRVAAAGAVLKIRMPGDH